jgi:hypothetical protein
MIELTEFALLNNIDLRYLETPVQYQATVGLVGLS